jgi:Flp pilus assembly protein TadB
MKAYQRQQRQFEQGRQGHQRFVKKMQEQNARQTQQQFAQFQERLRNHPPQPLDPAMAQQVRRGVGLVAILVLILFLIILAGFFGLAYLIFFLLHHAGIVLIT